MNDSIEIKGARVNNLKNIDVRIPRNTFTVIAGVSGSGKSSLAFDTLYAEGQRRYVESLSSYARQFLGRMNKPECDYIRGIPPAIAIEQKVISRNPRSTVGTTTEIYEYLRLLFARIGHTYSPISGEEVKKHSTEDVVQKVMTFSKGTRFMVMSPIHLNEDRTMAQQLKMYVQQGYARIFVEGDFIRIDDYLDAHPDLGDDTEIFLVIDRMSVDDAKDAIARLVDSAETAFFEGHGELRLIFPPSNICYDFSMRFEADGITFEEPSDQMFSFNSPVGACPECQGFGRIIGIDEKLVIPNTTLSVYDGCVVCWHGEKMKEWQQWFIRHAATDNFPIFEPYMNLTQQQKDWLWHGLPSDKSKKEKPCIDQFFQMVKENQYKIQYRVMLARYRGKTNCPCTSLGSSLVGSLYILDEPSIGLHSRDTDRLIHVLKELKAIGNTVVVVEHDEEIMRAADHLIDVGPDAGRLGGKIVFDGDAKDITSASLKKYPHSYTVKYLLHQEEIPVPKSRRPWNRHIDIKGARMNNLRGIDVKIPLNVMTVVTGVSGSGKSSLIKGILYPALKRHIGEVCDAPGEYLGLSGDIDAVKHVEFVDQNPIGKSTRSNPATYVKAYDSIRDLYAEQPLSQQMGFSSQFFSFNADGGRCEECKGAGVITVEMQFMADLVLECEACHGRRFKKDILDVNFHGKNIDDVLNMTISEAIAFFGEYQEKTIVKRLQSLEDVGLGYIKLGQSSSTLSGGENQRVKLAYFIGQEKLEPTLFIFDEPTTGLHFHDIHRLLGAFNALIERGHSILIIEHNMEVIKCADHVIDLGPDGGDKGGGLVIAGTPEEVARCEESLTGKYLKEKLT